MATKRQIPPSHPPATRGHRAIRALALLATMLAASAAAASSTLEQARENGSIRIGFANEAPFGYATPAGDATGDQVLLALGVRLSAEADARTIAAQFEEQKGELARSAGDEQLGAMIQRVRVRRRGADVGFDVSLSSKEAGALLSVTEGLGGTLGASPGTARPGTYAEFVAVRL